MAPYLVGSVVLLTLAGCGRSWLSVEQREPWRREAELSCLKSGGVKPTPAIVQIKSISGPGQCGAEYPFKVAAIGQNSALGFAELRPPGAIPRGFPIAEPRPVQPIGGSRMQPAYERPAYDRPAYEPQPQPQPQARGDAPLSLHPPGMEEPNEDDTADLDLPGAGDPPPVSRTERPRLGPDRGAAMSYAAAPATLQPAATLACPMVSALDSWIAGSIQPAAQRWFGQPVVEIKQISAYSCRGMNGQRGAPISEHAFGNALDISAFTLADGTKVVVKNSWRGSPEEQGFLRDVHASACEQFNTVLAPGSNVYHYDHIHVDLARRRSGRQVCNPAAVPGDVIAQRARDRIANGSSGRGRLGFAAENADVSEVFDLKLPKAIPGAD